MHGFNVLVIKLVLLCGRHVSSGRSTGLIQNISNIKVKCLVEFLANLAKYCRNLDIITVTSTKIVDGLVIDEKNIALKEYFCNLLLISSNSSTALSS